MDKGGKMSWRPESWKPEIIVHDILADEGIIFPDGKSQEVARRLIEAGADAMLRVLRTGGVDIEGDGIYLSDGRSVTFPYSKGKLVFIPNDGK